jgi:hypothetical protein
LVDPVHTCVGVPAAVSSTMNLLWAIDERLASRFTMAESGMPASLIAWRFRSRGSLAWNTGLVVPSGCFSFVVCSLTLRSTTSFTSTPWSMAFMSSASTGA